MSATLAAMPLSVCAFGGFLEMPVSFPHFASLLHEVVRPRNADSREDKDHVNNGLPHHASFRGACAVQAQGPGFDKCF